MPITAVASDQRCDVKLYLRTSPRPTYDLIELTDGTVTITTENWGVQTAVIVVVIVSAPGVTEKRYTVNVYGTNT